MKRTKLVLKKRYRNIVLGLAFTGIALMACIESDSFIPYIFCTCLVLPALLLQDYIEYDN